MNNLDLNKPVTNPRLSELMAKAKLVTQDQAAFNEQMNLVADEIVNRANLLAIAGVDDSKITDNGNGTATFHENSTINFHMLGAADGSTYLPLYTDWDNINMDPIVNSMKVSAIVMPFEQIASMMTNNNAGIVINPYNENLVITKDQIMHMTSVKAAASGVATEEIQKNTPIQLGEPKIYPTTMVNSIVAYAKKNKTINAIHLKLMQKEGQLLYLLIVDCNGNLSDVTQGIADAARPHVPQGYGLAMVPITDRLGQQAADNEAFYVKKKGLFGF